MIILTGGAIGSDTLFSELGIESIIYSFLGHNIECPPSTAKVIQLSQSELLKREKEYLKVCKILKRKYATDPYIRSLMLRNMFQIINDEYKSECVIAIGEINKNKKFIEGGTGYAIERAKMEKIPIIVLDKLEYKFYEFSYSENKFILPSKPFDITQYKVITGIGSRYIDSKHKEIIRLLFKMWEDNII